MRQCGYCQDECLQAKQKVPLRRCKSFMVGACDADKPLATGCCKVCSLRDSLRGTHLYRIWTIAL